MGGGGHRFEMFTLFVYFVQLAPSGRVFLPKWQGNKIVLNGRTKKLFQMRPQGGTKCMK